MSDDQEPDSPASGISADPSGLAAHRGMLIAQCPPIPPSSSDAPIHTTSWGTEGPRVLLVHGGAQGRLGGGPEDFARQASLAQKGWRLTSVHRPGFGASPSRGVDDEVADSVWIADMLERGGHLIGHSIGGAEALLAAGRRPDAVRSLILIEPLVPPLLLSDEAARNAPGVQEELARQGRAMLSAASPGQFAIQAARTIPTEAAREIVALFEGDPDEALRMGCSLLQRRTASLAELTTAAETVAAAAIPVLVITGGWSASVDATGRAVAARTNGRHVLIESDHYIQVTRATEFNEHADAFLRAAEERVSPRP